MLSLSVAEISIEEEALVAPFTVYRVTRSKWDRAIFSEMGLQNIIFAI